MKKENINAIIIVGVIILIISAVFLLNRKADVKKYVPDPSIENVIFVNEKKVYPEELNISFGESVTWFNNRSDGRTGLARIKGAKGFELDSQDLLPGQMYTYQFNKTGEYEWVDVIRFFPGKIIVR